jgi:glycine C-acetyltransferase
MVDDAHAVGIIGDHGRGTASHFGVEGQCDIQVGGFSKAPGVIGGYVACSRKLRELIMRKSNQYRHTQPLPPPVVAACIASLHLLESDAGELLIKQAWDNANLFRSGLRQLGFVIPEESKTPLVPIILKDTNQAFRLSDGLWREGVYLVFKNRESLRAIITAGHTREQLARAISAFEKVGRELGIVGGPD